MSCDDLDYEDWEPDCTCERVDVDMYDPWCCEFHNPGSQWNVARRADELSRRRESESVYGGVYHRMIITTEDAPF